jgi:RNA recognition motif-containing protein
VLPKTCVEHDLHMLFHPFGELREVHIIHGVDGSPKGCAFVKFATREAALAAIGNLKETIPNVSHLAFYCFLPYSFLL